ncbi:MAG: hypothetical protein RLZZ543_461 [Bacteroidota bacterium]|jgi:hypothetical protein
MNRLSRLSLLLHFSCALLTGTSALKGQSTSYKILENDPDRKNLIITLSPFYANTYAPDINLGYGIQANWMMNNRIQLDVDLRKAYLDEHTKAAFSPLTGLKNAHFYTAGAAFNLRSKTKTKKVKVILDRQTFGSRYERITYIRVPSEVKRFTSVHGGVLSTHNNLEIENDFTRALGSKDLYGKSPDGTVALFRDTINYETINYVANSYGIYAGLDFSSIRDLIIETDSYGKKGTHVHSNVYFDMLFCPVVHYSIRPNEKQSMFKDIDISIPQNAKKYLGWRAGYRYASGKSVGFGTTMEIGQQPGAAGSGFYCHLGMGITIKARMLKRG